ncbi:hypothetical protein J2R76_000061 [Bradyrhizobium sp. USDA 4532]|nr:hypothetical protein [Bradyrhizobium sp. USDA 4545]MCP1916470.1 hypothetical protein [Bradyrhizobium sp. USDA 4532]
MARAGALPRRALHQATAASAPARRSPTTTRMASASLTRLSSAASSPSASLQRTNSSESVPLPTATYRRPVSTRADASDPGTIRHGAGSASRAHTSMSCSLRRPRGLARSRCVGRETGRPPPRDGIGDHREPARKDAHSCRQLRIRREEQVLRADDDAAWARRDGRGVLRFDFTGKSSKAIDAAGRRQAHLGHREALRRASLARALQVSRRRGDVADGHFRRRQWLYQGGYGTGLQRQGLRTWAGIVPAALALEL